MSSKFIRYQNAVYVLADSGAVELQTEQFEQHKTIELESTFNRLVELLPSEVTARPEIVRAVRSVLTQIEGIKAMVAGNPDPEDADDIALQHFVEDGGPDAGMGNEEPGTHDTDMDSGDAGDVPPVE